MSEDMIALLLRLAAGSTLAAIAVLLLVAPLRRLLGAESAYRLWLAVPLATVGAAWPKPATESAPALAEAMVIVGDAGPAAATSATAATDVAPAVALAWLWLAGALCAAALMWLRQRLALRGLEGPAPDGSWRHPGGLGPALVGAWRPRLVLPADFEARYDARERQLILLHEDVHRARRDGAWNLLAALLLCLGWFNPIAYLAHARFRRDQELACDAAVLRLAPGSARPYAGAMLKAAGAARWLPAGCHWPPRHALVERIAALGLHGRATLARPLCTALVAALVLGLAATAHAVQPAPVAAPEAPATGKPAPAYYLIKGTLLRDGQPNGRPTIVVAAGQPGAIGVDGEGGYRLRFLAGSGDRGGSVLEATIDADDGRLPAVERRFAFDRVLADAVLETRSADGRSMLGFAFRVEALTEAEWQAVRQEMQRGQDAEAFDAPTTDDSVTTAADASPLRASIRSTSGAQPVTSRESPAPHSGTVARGALPAAAPVSTPRESMIASTAPATAGVGGGQSAAVEGAHGDELPAATAAGEPVAGAGLGDPGRANAAASPAASPADTGLAVPPRVLHRTLASPRSRAIRFSAEDINLQRPLDVPMVLAIDARGRLQSATVQGDVPPAAADAARRWVEQWRYAAARDAAGERVAGTLQVTARFWPPQKFIAVGGSYPPVRD